MNLGYFTMPMHPPQKRWALALAEDREAFQLADALGYSEGYCGSHYTDAFEKIPSPLIFLATLADCVHSMRLGTATINLPNHHPVELAAEIAMLDHLLNGRFNMGIGAGALKSDAEAFGTGGQNRVKMFLESINTIQRIWTTSPPYNIEGTFWSVTTQNSMDARIGMGEIPKPLQDPIPIFTTVVEPYSKGIEAAARNGWMPISANFTHDDWLASHWEMAARGFAATGRDTGIEEWRVARSIFVAENAKTARNYVMAADSPYRAYFENLFAKFQAMQKTAHFRPRHGEGATEASIEDMIQQILIFGDVSSVADQINALRAKVGPFGTLLYVGADWADPDLGRNSMRMMAEQVLPKINS